MTYWWVNSQDPAPYPSAQETVIKNLHIWQVFNVGVYHYPAARMTFDGLVIRGADIQGMQRGIITSEFQYGTGSIENSYFRTSDYAIAVPISGSVNNSSPRAFPPRRFWSVIQDSTRSRARPSAALAQAAPVLPRGIPMPHRMKSRWTTIKAIRVISFRCTGQTPDCPASSSMSCVSAAHPEVGGILRHPRRSRRRHDRSGGPDQPASHAVTATVAAAFGTGLSRIHVTD